MDSDIHLINNWWITLSVYWTTGARTTKMMARQIAGKRIHQRQRGKLNTKFYFQSFPRAFAFSFDVAFVSRLGTVRFLLPIEQIKLYRKEKTSALHMTDLASVWFWFEKLKKNASFNAIIWLFSALKWWPEFSQQETGLYKLSNVPWM